MKSRILSLIEPDHYTEKQQTRALNRILDDMDADEIAALDAYRRQLAASERLVRMSQSDEMLVWQEIANIEPQYAEERSYGEPLASIGPSDEYSRKIYADDENPLGSARMLAWCVIGGFVAGCAVIAAAIVGAM